MSRSFERPGVRVGNRYGNNAAGATAEDPQPPIAVSPPPPARQPDWGRTWRRTGQFMGKDAGTELQDLIIGAPAVTWVIIRSL